jgi:hypothetical protein
MAELEIDPAGAVGGHIDIADADVVEAGGLSKSRPVTALAQSMHRCRRTLPPFVESRLVVNAIVVERTALRLAIPDCDWAFGRRHQHELAYRLPDKGCNAAPRPRKPPCVMRRAPLSADKLESSPYVAIY